MDGLLTLLTLLFINANSVLEASNTPFTRLYVNPELTTDFDCPTIHRSCKVSSTPDPKRSSVLHCSCSPSCFQDGDCCLDAPISHLQQAPIGRTQCVTIGGQQTISYHMITSCPASWPDDTVRTSCDLKGDIYKDEISLVPVSSLTSNATYRNLYCAICNGERDSLVSWNVEFTTCSRKGKFFQDLLKKCSRHGAKPAHLEALGIGRVCEPGVVSECHQKTEVHVRARQFCHAYFAPVKTKWDRVYKNKFCAFCSGETYENLRCTDVKRKRLLLGGYAGFDLSSTKYIFGFGVSFAKTSKCDANHIYVDWAQQNGPKMKSEGRCIWVGQGNDKKIFTKGEDCPGDFKLYNDYSIDSEGKALIYETNTTIPKNGYHVLDNSSLLICLEIQPPITFQGLLFVICSCISLVALLLKVLVHLFLPEPRTVSSMSVAALSLSLFLAQLSLLFGVDKNDFNFHFCLVMACVIHYFLLVSFCWTNVLAYDIFKSFSSLRHVVKSSNYTKKRFLRFNIYAWLTPLIFVTLALVFDRVSLLGDILKPGYGLGLCWFTNNKALLVFFGVPFAMILGTNVFFFVVTSTRIYKTSKEVKIVRRNTCGRIERVRFRMYIKLALIMGLTWLLAFIAAYVNSDILWNVFDILHALQGTFIFVGFTDFQVRSKVARLRRSWVRMLSTSTQSEQITPLQRESSSLEGSKKDTSKTDLGRNESEDIDGNGNSMEIDKMNEIEKEIKI